MSHIDPIAPLYPCQRAAQMLVIDPLQAQFVAHLVMLEGKAGILLDDARQRPRQLDVILAVGGFDREAGVARRLLDVDRRGQVAARQP